MPDDELAWEIMQDAEAHALTVYRSNGHVADSEGPTLYSREEALRFVDELRKAVDRVWPERKHCRTNRVFVERLHEGDLVCAVSGGPEGRVIDTRCGWTIVRYANGAELPYRHGTDRLFLIEAATS